MEKYSGFCGLFVDNCNGQGGHALQFDGFDAEALRDAQRYPERYASLPIRVTVRRIYFTTLSKVEQDTYIARNIHTM